MPQQTIEVEHLGSMAPRAGEAFFLPEFLRFGIETASQTIIPLKFDLIGGKNATARGKIYSTWIGVMRAHSDLGAEMTVAWKDGVVGVVLPHTQINLPGGLETETRKAASLQAQKVRDSLCRALFLRGVVGAANKGLPLNQEWLDLQGLHSPAAAREKLHRLYQEVIPGEVNNLARLFSGGEKALVEFKGKKRPKTNKRGGRPFLLVSLANVRTVQVQQVEQQQVVAPAKKTDFKKAVVILGAGAALAAGCSQVSPAPAPTNLKPPEVTPTIAPAATATHEAPPSPVTTSTSDLTPTPPETQAICALSSEQIAETLFSQGISQYESVPLITEEKSSGYIGQEALDEAKDGIRLMVQRLVEDGTKAIEIPAFAKDLAAEYQGSDVAINVKEDIKQTTPEGYWSVEAIGFPAGGYAILVKDDEGDYKVALPLNDTDLSDWVFYPEEDVYFTDLPAQRFWGELKWVRLPGCSATAVQIDPEGKVLTVLNPEGKVDDINSVWKVNSAVTQIKPTETVDIAKMTDKRIFDILGTPDPADYSLEVQLSPYKILRNPGGESYALYQGENGIVYLARNIETGTIEHAVYATYEGEIGGEIYQGIPILVLTDKTLLEQKRGDKVDGGWFGLNPVVPDAQERVGDAFQQALGLYYWVKKERPNERSPFLNHTLYKYEMPDFTRVPGYAYLKAEFEKIYDHYHYGYDQASGELRSKLNAFWRDLFLMTLKEKKAAGEPLELRLKDKGGTVVDFTKINSVVVKFVLSGKYIFPKPIWDSRNAAGDFGGLHFVRADLSPASVTLYVDDFSYNSRDIFYGSKLTAWLRYFWGATYFSPTNYKPGFYGNFSEDFTPGIAAAMCPLDLQPEKVIRETYYKFGLPFRTFNYSPLYPLPGQNCAVKYLEINP